MPNLEFWLFLLLLGGLVVGGWSIRWARASRACARRSWGRGLFVATLLILGGSNMLAAFHRAETLVPMGLTAGLLVVAMLWESPPTPRTDP